MKRSLASSCAKLLSFLAPLSLLALMPACVPTAPSVPSQSGELGGVQVNILRDDNHGISWNIPKAFPGHFTKDEHATMAFEFNGNGITTLSVINLHGLDPDEYALACASLRSMNMQYPSPQTRQLPSTYQDGVKWLHFEGTDDFRGANVKMRFSAAKHKGLLITMFGLDMSALRQPFASPPVGDLWQYVRFDSEPRPYESLALNGAELRRHESRISQIAYSYYERKRYAEAIPFLELLCKINPLSSGHAEGLAENLLASEDYEKAEQRIAELRITFPQASGLIWRHAVAMGKLGRDTEAMEYFNKALFEKKSNQSNAIGAYLSYLAEEELLAENVEIVRELVNRSGDVGLQTFLARAYLDSGDKENARKVTDALVDKCEVFPYLAHSVISIYLDIEDYDQALEIARRIAAQKNPMGNYLAAATLMREGRYSEARDEVLLCLEKTPSDQNAKDLLDGINAQLGKADSSSFRTPIEAVPLPEFMQTLIPETPEGFDADFGCHYIHYGTAYLFQSDKRLRRTMYGSYSVSTLEAIRRMNDLRFPFDPLYERVYVNFLRVYGPDGELLGEVKLDDCYTANDPDKVLMSQKKELHIPVPMLSPGCRVDFAVSFETLGRTKKMPYQLRQLGMGLPVLLSFTSLDGEREKIATFSANGVLTGPASEEAPDAAPSFFYVVKPEVNINCPNLPSPSQYVPSVWICSSEDNWADEVKEYYDVVKFIDETSPEAEAKVKELLPEDCTPEQAVQILSDFVRSNLTYHGIEFGMRAMVPNRCCEILRNRYGDCKDHSFLLMHMLRTAGVKANLALVDSRRDINADVPNSGQFDHMIVYLPEYQGGRFIDATEKGLSEIHDPIYLSGSPALILDLENPRMEYVAKAQLGINGFDIQRKVSVLADGSALVEETVNFRGLWAAMMRGYLRYVSPAEYASTLLPELKVDNLRSVKSISVENLDKMRENVVMKYSYSIDHAFASTGELLVGSSPLTWEMWEMHVPNDIPQRTLPILQRNHAVFNSTTSITLPEGFLLASQPQAQLLDNKYLSFKMDYSNGGDTLTVNGSYSRFSGLYEASERDEREAAYAQARKSASTPIVLVNSATQGKIAAQ